MITTHLFNRLGALSLDPFKFEQIYGIAYG